MTQRGLDVGVLVAWTKSFNCPGVVGQDAVKMLNDAVKRVGHLPVKVVSLLVLQYDDYVAANKMVTSSNNATNQECNISYVSQDNFSKACNNKVLVLKS
jgi:hexokinase